MRGPWEACFRTQPKHLVSALHKFREDLKALGGPDKVWRPGGRLSELGSEGRRATLLKENSIVGGGPVGVVSEGFTLPGP